MTVNLSDDNKSELLDLAEALLQKASGEPSDDSKTTPLINFWLNECKTTYQCIDTARDAIELVKENH